MKPLESTNWVTQELVTKPGYLTYLNVPYITSTDINQSQLNFKNVQDSLNKTIEITPQMIADFNNELGYYIPNKRLLYELSYFTVNMITDKHWMGEQTLGMAFREAILHETSSDIDL